jgi:hypothetical protein
MTKKKTNSIIQHLEELLEGDKTARRKLTPKQKLAAITMLQAELAKERGEKPAPSDYRAPGTVRVPSARTQTLIDRNNPHAKQEAENLARALESFERGHENDSATK